MAPVRRGLQTLLVTATISLAITVLACAPAAQEDGGASQAAGEQATGEMDSAMADAADVEEAFDAFEVAWEGENQEALAEIFTDDAVVFDPVPPGKFAGTEGIDGLLTATFEQQDEIEISVSERTVHTEGGVGWMTGRFVYEAQPVGECAEPVRDEGYVPTLWVLQPDGSYGLALFHASPLPEAPEEGGE